MSIKIRILFLNFSYFLKSTWTSGNSFLKDPSSLMMIHPKSNRKQKLTSHFIEDQSHIILISVAALLLVLMNMTVVGYN